jgi:hypothetical protein
MSEAEINKEDTLYPDNEGRQRLLKELAWKRIGEFIKKREECGPIEGGRTWRREDLYDRRRLNSKGDAK